MKEWAGNTALFYFIKEIFGNGCYKEKYCCSGGRKDCFYRSKPLFVIEDEELLADARWKDVKALYEKIQANDVETVLNLPSDRFDSVFAELPVGIQNAVKSEIATRMEAGTFDSIQKIKTVDRVCGTDLICLL